MEKIVVKKLSSEALEKAKETFLTSLLAFVDYKGLLDEYNDFVDKFMEFVGDDDSDEFDIEKFKEYLDKDGVRSA